MASNNPDGRPPKYPNLGHTTLMRVPTQLQPELRELFRALNEIGNYIDPSVELSDMVEGVRNKIEMMREEEN